jgi:hypothetical protein
MFNGLVVQERRVGAASRRDIFRAFDQIGGDLARGPTGLCAPVHFSLLLAHRARDVLW